MRRDGRMAASFLARVTPERLCSLAGPGEVLASDVVIRSAVRMPSVKVIERGRAQ